MNRYYIIRLAQSNCSEKIAQFLFIFLYILLNLEKMVHTTVLDNFMRFKSDEPFLVYVTYEVFLHCGARIDLLR